MDYVFDLPIELIQHIQSFIENTREKAQTCILSKSWFDAWSTHPMLIFNQAQFPEIYSYNYFIIFCRKTMQRYKLLDLKVHSLSFSSYRYDISNYHNLVDELVMDALELGVKKITLIGGESSTICVLAQVFASKSITSISLCAASGGNQFVVGGCPRLTSLYLFLSHFTDQNFQDILLGCPFIENLELRACEGLTTVDLSKMQKLVKVVISGNGYYYDREHYVDFKFHNIGLTATHGFQYLRSLHLNQVKLFHKEFFTKFSSTFPCIEELNLRSVSGFKDVQISSNSLRYLSLATGHVLKKVKLNVPNISELNFDVVKSIPFLSFGKTASRNWKCKINLFNGHDFNDDSWFLEFKKFLTELSTSRIYVRIWITKGCTVSTERIRCFPIPVVEKLAVYISQSAMSLNLLCGLFWSCQPSFIYPNLRLPLSGFADFLYEHLIQNDSKDLLGMYNLEEFNLEQKKYLMEWQSFPLGDYLNARHRRCKTRFRVRWANGGFTGQCRFPR